jgi:uncharacterized protein YjiS (DUF1127 family)
LPNALPLARSVASQQPAGFFLAVFVSEFPATETELLQRKQTAAMPIGNRAAMQRRFFMTMTIDTPATTKASASLGRRLGALMAALGGWIRFRNTLTSLDELDDHALRDIGLHREDLIELRLASSATTTLATVVRRRQRW